MGQSGPKLLPCGLLNDQALLTALFLMNPHDLAYAGCVKWPVPAGPFYRISGARDPSNAGEVREALERQFKVNVEVRP